MPFPGTVWAPNTWDVDAWAANTWADASEPPAEVEFLTGCLVVAPVLSGCLSAAPVLNGCLTVEPVN